MESSLLVAPITTTSPRLSSPSIRARRVDTMELLGEKYAIQFRGYERTDRTVALRSHNSITRTFNSSGIIFTSTKALASARDSF